MKFRDLINNSASTASIRSLNELAFSEKNIRKSAKLYGSIMGKRMGGVFKIVGLEEFKRTSGTGKGIRTINDSAEQLRFNWDAKFAKHSQFELTSIDYWGTNNTNFQHPTRTVRFGPELNVIQVMDKLVKALQSGTLSESQKIIDDANEILIEKRTGKEKQDWVKTKGLKPYYAKKDDIMRKMIKDKQPDLVKDLEIFLGAKESNTFEGSLKKIEKTLQKQLYSDPATVFEDIEDLVSVVAAKEWKSLMITGQSGVGKTYGVIEGPRSLKALLGPEGKKWIYHAGIKASPLAFFKTLFMERDKIVVFDEADAVLKHSEIVMMLKPILDTGGANTAEYLTGTKNMSGKSNKYIDEYSNNVKEAIEKGAMIVQKNSPRMWDPMFDAMEADMSEYDIMLPSKFIFTGGMIFISNMPASNIEKALLSRSIYIDINLALQDKLKRIKQIGYTQANSNAGHTVNDVDEVLEALGAANGKEHKIDYMTPEYARKSKEITIRALQLGLILKTSGLARWKELTELYA